jgi:hypothetical protein
MILAMLILPTNGLRRRDLIPRIIRSSRVDQRQAKYQSETQSSALWIQQNLDKTERRTAELGSTAVES